MEMYGHVGRESRTVVRGYGNIRNIRKYVGVYANIWDDGNVSDNQHM